MVSKRNGIVSYALATKAQDETRVRRRWIILYVRMDPRPTSADDNAMTSGTEESLRDKLETIDWQ